MNCIKSKVNKSYLIGQNEFPSKFKVNMKILILIIKNFCF